MSQRFGEPKQSVEDALVQRVAARSGGRAVLAKPLEELGMLDRAVYEAVAATSTPVLDGHFRGLSRAADHSVLWLGIAAVVAVGGRNGRRTAIESVLAIGAASAIVNLGIKPLARRRRPVRADPVQFEARVVPMPESASFPSGHAASAFAFAYAVGRHQPELAVPIRPLAGGVAYSRVHTGVHYPGDVVIGAILGAGVAAMVGAACDRPFKRAPDYAPDWADYWAIGGKGCGAVRGDSGVGVRAAGEAPGWRAEIRTRSAAGRTANCSGASSSTASPSMPAWTAADAWTLR